MSKNCWTSGKQCRPRWDAAFCGVSSGSILYSDTSTPYHICSKIWTSTIYYPMLCLKIAGWVANSVDPDETPHSAASHLGLYWLLRPVYPNTYGKYGNTSFRSHVYQLKSSMCDNILKQMIQISTAHLNCLIRTFISVNPLYTDTRYNDKIRYTGNENLNVTKHSLRRWQLLRNYAHTLHIILKQHMFWIFVKIASERRF